MAQANTPSHLHLLQDALCKHEVLVESRHGDGGQGVVVVEVVGNFQTEKLEPPEPPIDNVASHHTATAT
jgi:hypothetical protein